ncbi:MAG TPA: M14 family zinc carboxypeptidase [Blastocatellia bacterium]|nr:M14 family zinc carboxypeptidase [Blastocatellia bacterium]
MNTSGSHRKVVVTGILLAASALLLVSWTPTAKVSARSGRVLKYSNPINVQRAARHANLQSRLESTNLSEFQNSLAALSRMDEPGVLDVWQTALNNSDVRLRLEAWRRYGEVQAEISRKQYVPQIARINATAEKITALAKDGGYDITIWTSSDNQSVVAAPPYLIEHLRNEGITSRILYNSVLDWQKARSTGDVIAQAITPEYQTDSSEASQIRIAVINLADRTSATQGYSDWLGEREDILMQDGSRLAYLDIFESDGSDRSITNHIAERYTRRGFKLEGFYSPEEFADRAPQLFPGKSFDAGRRSKTARNGEVSLALANGKFHSYDQTISEFKALATAHPDLAVYSKLGTSFEGRDIFALKISKNASVDDVSKPEVLITGLHHAREWISVESPVYFANRLVNGYATEDSVRYLVDHLQIWVVPIVNPDGLNYTQASPNDQMDPIRLWRKNRRPISAGACTAGVGVDLNRNYGYHWRLLSDLECPNFCDDRSCLNDDVGGSDEPSNDIYRGPKAESEPEVKAVKALVDDPNRHFRAQLDYHNYAQLILYPWGYSSLETDDNSTLSGLAQRMSDALFAVDRKRYRPEQAIDLYTLTGSSIDYAYGVNHVPAPFVVEMRPDCCDFSVSEAQIPVVNQETWAGAQQLFNWAAGPPILESVKAYTPGPDGSFSRLVYSARWISSPDSNGFRQLTVETRFPGIDPGRLQVRLQFSKPMNTSVDPIATLGRDSRLNEVTLAAMRGDEGWQTTVYTYDTWVGETVLVDDGNLTSVWRVAVSASDSTGLMLDATPFTIASYRAGGSQWDRYEDSNGNGNSGGTDSVHTIGPGVRGDYPSILVATPSGGERLAAGDDYVISWTSPTTPGFTQSLSLSTDGGFSFSPLADNIPSDAQRFRVTMPRISTSRGRIRLLATEPVNHNFMAAVSMDDFSIGVNVGSNIDVSFVSSEKIDLNWVDMSTDEPPSTASGASRLIINLTVKNRGNIPIASPFLRVAEMNRHVLLTRDPKSNWTVGARFYIDAGDDNVLSPGEIANARLVVGLINAKKFFLSVSVYGVPDQLIVPASAADVWSGKPRSR